MQSPHELWAICQDAAVRRLGDLIISSILRGGVLLSVVVILVGIAGVYISLPRAALPATFPDTLPAVLSGSLQGTARHCHARTTDPARHALGARRGLDRGIRHRARPTLHHHHLRETVAISGYRKGGNRNRSA
jgi:hypothetical protein